MGNPFALFPLASKQLKTIYLSTFNVSANFELSFHPTMLAIWHLRTFLVDLNVFCLSNQNNFWIVKTIHMF